MAALTEQAEKKAKGYSALQPDKQGKLQPEVLKNALCLFPNPRALEYNHNPEPGKGWRLEERTFKHRDVYPWPELLDELRGEGDYRSVIWAIRTLLKADNGHLKSWLPSAQVYNLFQLGELWSREGYISLPKLAYALKRLEDRMSKQKEANPEVQNRLEEFKSFLYQSAWLEENKEGFQKVNIRDYKTIFTWLSYLTRKESKDDQYVIR